MSLVIYASIGVGILIYGILRGIEALIRYQRDLNRSYVIRVDGDAGTYELERRRIKSSTIRTGKANEGKTEILQGQARLSGEKGSMYLLHARHGWNLRVPTDKETIDASRRMQVFSISNPASYFQAEHRNDSRDALDANQEPEPWYGKLAVPLLVVGVAVIGVLIFLVVKVQALGG